MRRPWACSCACTSSSLGSTSPLAVGTCPCGRTLREVPFPFDAFGTVCFDLRGSQAAGPDVGRLLTGFASRRTARPGFSRPPRASSRSLPGLFRPGCILGVLALQRSVRAPGRTPLGWPCPSFPWPQALACGCRPSVGAGPSNDRGISVRSAQRRRLRALRGPGCPVSGGGRELWMTCLPPELSLRGASPGTAPWGALGSKDSSTEARAWLRGGSSPRSTARTSLGLPSLQGLHGRPWAGFRQPLPSRSWPYRTGRCRSLRVSIGPPRGCRACRWPHPPGLLTLLPTTERVRPRLSGR